MFAIVLLAFFIAIAVAGVLGLTADSRDLRPRLPLQARGPESDLHQTERVGPTALPPYPRAHLRTH